MAFVVPFFATIGSALGASSAAAAATGALATGVGVSALGSVVQGEGQAQASEYNAAIARQNALITQQQGDAAVQAQQRDSARQIGRMKAAYGASGVQLDSGSPLDVLAESASMAALDSLTLKYNYALKAAGLQSQASLEDKQASTSRTSAILGAGSSVLKGYGMYTALSGSAIPGVLPGGVGNPY